MARDSEYGEFDKEKFAELLVRECVQVVDDMADPEDSERYFWAIQNVSQKIKKHFGVEETTVPLDDPSFLLFQMKRNYPPECTTEAEKNAFAFGWWKAMEELKNK